MTVTAPSTGSTGTQWASTLHEAVGPAEIAALHKAKCEQWTGWIADRLRRMAADIEKSGAIQYGGEQVTLHAVLAVTEILTAGSADVGYKLAHLAHQTALAQFWQQRVGIDLKETHHDNA